MFQLTDSMGDGESYRLLELVADLGFARFEPSANGDDLVIHAMRRSR